MKQDNAINKLLSRKPFLRVIEAVNCLEAYAAEAAFSCGADGEKITFDALWLSGLCHAAAKGMPDNGSVPVSEKCNVIGDIKRISDKPIFVDCDTDCSPESISAYEKAGASAAVIEDKKGVKHNSLYGSSKPHKMESADAFADRLKTARSASQNILIFARTESLIAGENVRDALSRAEKYISAGADGIVIHSTETDGKNIFLFAEMFKDMHPDVPLVFIPTMYNSFDCDTLHQHGADIIIYANQLTRSAYKAMLAAANSILGNGCSKYADENYCESVGNILKITDGDRNDRY